MAPRSGRERFAAATGGAGVSAVIAPPRVATAPSAPPALEQRLPSLALFWNRPDRSFHLGRALAARGFRVTLYNVAGYGAAPYVRLRGDVATACATALRSRHDVYLGSLSFTPTLCLEVNRRLTGRPYVFNCTGVMWEMYRDRARGKPCARVVEQRVYPALARLVLGGAARIVCNSAFLAGRLSARYPEYAPKILTIHNGIDAARYGAGRARALPGVTPGAPVVLCVTTLNFEGKSRGLDLVLDAFTRVWRARPDARLVIAAKVAHPRYAERATAMAARLACPEAVSFIWNATDVPDLLASSDVLAFATPEDSNDSLPRVLLEAQAAGVPCVTTHTTGCAEAVADGRTGRVVPYDAAAMAEGILDLLDRPDVRRELGQAARARIGAEFTWHAMAEAYAQVFLDVDAQARAARARPRSIR
jgi:glycosyltransferase involved in cell wall biosynthesis